MTTGTNDLKNVSLPTAWDADELARIQMRDGTTYDTLVADIDAALQLVNSDLTTGYFANLVSITDEPFIEYRSGSGGGFEDATEYAQPDAQRAGTSGHMLPLQIKDRKLGWTYLYLLNAQRQKLDADIAGLAQDAHDVWEQAILNRLFKMEEETGKQYRLGTSGVSVPFADGGNGTIAFTPPPVPNRASSFDSTHDHFLRISGITQANLETAVKSVWEHGHDGPFELLVSLADLSSWTDTASVTGYVSRADPLVQYGQNTSLAQVHDIYVGGVTTDYGFCRLVPNGRIPTGYWGVTKSYGPLDPRNPLRVRFDEQFGFGVKLITNNVGQFPLEGAVGMFLLGVGVGEDRTAAVLVENDSAGDYASPTIA